MKFCEVAEDEFTEDEVVEQGVHMDEKLQEYRNLLLDAEKKSQEDFDKTIIALSGGALGISFAFVKDIVGNDPLVNSWLLFVAWISWGFSLAFILLSFYFSQQAFRRAIEQVDSNEIYNQNPGGWQSKVTSALNFLGMLALLFGIGFMVAFVYFNLR